MSHAILLAAGRGRRLGSDAPKCLLDIDGVPLLDRHVACMRGAGIRRLTVVVGFKKEMILGRLEQIRAQGKAEGLSIDFIENPAYERGSIVSLQVASEHLENGAIWMDADVLYPAALLAKLVSSRHDNCVLCDPRSEEQGEEMMLGIRGDRVLAIARRVGTDWDRCGEAVGFAKVGPAGGKLMSAILRREVAADRLDQEYEAAMNEAFKEIPFGYETIDEFDWTEIDFPEDVEKARGIAYALRA